MNYEKFIQENEQFINGLAQELGETRDKRKVVRALKSVLHILRDRLTVQQSFHVLSQLPAPLKLYYVEEWKFREKPIRFTTIGSFCRAVEEVQAHYGERDFFNISTEDVVHTVLESLRQYLDEGTIHKILNELPLELYPLFD